MTTKNFSVVVFEDTDQVDVVPLGWLSVNKTECRWPPYKDSAKVRKAIKNALPPQDNWTTHPVRLLKSYGKYYNQ